MKKDHPNTRNIILAKDEELTNKERVTLTQKEKERINTFFTLCSGNPRILKNSFLPRDILTKLDIIIFPSCSCITIELTLRKDNKYR